MWPALVQAGAQIVGGLIGRGGQQATNAQNIEIARETNQFNAAEAQKQRDYETSMSNTQYQRGVADMRAAGINPALAYTQGGAGTPGGSTASGVSTRVDNPNAALGSNVSAGLSTALNAMNTLKQGRVLEATAANQQAQAYQHAVEGGRTQLDINRLSSDDASKALNDTINANLATLRASAGELQARAGSEAATAAKTSQDTAQQKMTPTWQRIAQPWINDAKGAQQLFRTFMAAADPFLSGE